MGHLKTVGILLDIKHLTAEGLSKSQIARRLGMDRGTVTKYLAMDKVPEQIRRKAVSHKIDDFVDHIKARLAKYPELTAERLFREIEKLGYTGSRRSVRRHVAQFRPQQQRVYKPFETLPGEQAQVDWGHEGTFEENGQRLNLYSFNFILSHCRLRYVEYTTSQDMATFLACHQRALQYIGGCPREIVYDNAKTVVLDRVGTVVRFHPELLRFAAGYGFKPRACWVNDPESKGKVESTVKYVRRDFFYGTEFTTLSNLNEQRLTWLNEVANRKVSEATGRVPFEHLAEERSFLQPLPAQPVGTYAEAEAQVTKTCLFSWGGNQYSVPDQLARHKVKLHVYEDHLEVYFAGKQVVSLPRLHGKGQRLIQDEHYTGRSAGPGAKQVTLQQRFEALGPVAHTYLKGLAQSKSSSLREQVESILGLCEAYSEATVHAAMERAAHYGNYSYKAVKRILLRQERAPESLPQQPAEGLFLTISVPAVHVEQRSLEYYAQAGRR
jgi:transposase